MPMTLPVNAVVVELYRDVRSAFYNVVVGHNIAVGGNDDAAAGTLFVRLTVFSLLRGASSEKSAEEVFKGILNGIALRLSLHGDFDVNNGIHTFFRSCRQIDQRSCRRVDCGEECAQQNG